MQSNLNDTQSAPDTGNPQNVGESANPSNGADFQQTAPQDLLKQEQRQSLSVQETGEPLPAGSSTVAVDGGLSLLWWALLIVLAVVVGSILAIRFLGEREDENITEESPKLASSSPSKSSTAKAKKRPARTKSGKPVKSRKKSSKKRR